MEILTRRWTMSTTYIVEKWDGEGTELQTFFIIAADKLSRMYGDNYDWRKFDLIGFAKKHRVMICWRDDRPVGFMLSRLGSSFFDPDFVILRQILLYGQPGTRAAYLLMQDFIDFGKNNANHIITMLNTKTNIKRQSLEKLGFVKSEQLYKIEV